MDNSSWFDFDGTALPTAQIYSLVRTGASTDRRIASVDSSPVRKIAVGEIIDWNTITVTAKYNDGTEEQKPVTCDDEEQEVHLPIPTKQENILFTASFPQKKRNTKLN